MMMSVVSSHWQEESSYSRAEWRGVSMCACVILMTAITLLFQVRFKPLRIIYTPSIPICPNSFSVWPSLHWPLDTSRLTVLKGSWCIQCDFIYTCISFQHGWKMQCIFIKKHDKNCLLKMLLETKFYNLN